MEDRTLTSDIHLSRMIGWALNTLGKALLFSVLASIVGGVVGALLSQGEAPGLGWALAGLAGPLTFGAVLYNASAPLPYTREELGAD